jgi:predicted PurR-regulated permease PerM
MPMNFHELFDTEHLKYYGLVAATLTAVVGALFKFITYVKSLINQTANWIKDQVHSIVREEIAPLKASAETQYEIIHEIKATVEQFLPNGGSHFRDLVEKLNTNIESMKSDDK